MAVGRALILQCLLVARALAAPLRANLVFKSDGLLRRVEMLSAGVPSPGMPHQETYSRSATASSWLRTLQ